MDLLQSGYTIVKNIFSVDEINLLRSEALKFFENGGGFTDSTGRARPDWIKANQLKLMYVIWKSKTN